MATLPYKAYLTVNCVGASYPFYLQTAYQPESNVMVTSFIINKLAIGRLESGLVDPDDGQAAHKQTTDRTETVETRAMITSARKQGDKRPEAGLNLILLWSGVTFNRCLDV